MKRIKPFLIFFLIVIFVNACKKDKAASTPPPDPIAVYKFDNDWATNSASSLLNGLVVGNVSSSLDSFLTNYGCFQFKGDGYVKVEDSDLINFPGNQFTLACWIKPTKVSTSYIIIKNDEDKGYSPYTLDIHPGKVRSFIRSKNNDQFIIEGKTPIIKDAWQHIAVTFSGTALTVYYNGNNDGSVAVDRPLAVKKGDLAIGGRIENFPSACFQGSVDNVKIYDKALTDAQVKNLYLNYKD